MRFAHLTLALPFLFFVFGVIYPDGRAIEFGLGAALGLALGLWLRSELKEWPGYVDELRRRLGDLLDGRLGKPLGN
jgi:hypothetical protein